MPDKDTLEAVLLRKATSIGAPKLPPVTQSMMPMPAKMLGSGWVNPTAEVSVPSIVNELKRLAQVQIVGNVKRHWPNIQNATSKGLDWMLDYDPTIAPVKK
jgi:hypothetical protein